MTINNVTRRASKTMYLLSKAHEGLSPLMYELKGDDNLKQLFDNLALIDEAQQELVRILAQDNRVEVRD